MSKPKTTTTPATTTKASLSASAGSKTDSPTKKKWSGSSNMLLLLGTCIALTIVFNYYHSHRLSPLNNSLDFVGHHKDEENEDDHRKHKASTPNQLLPHKNDFIKHAQAFSKQKQEKKDPDKKSSPRQEQQRRKHNHQDGKLATLNCKAHGGPMDPAAAQDMVYWKDIPSDSHYRSPFHQLNNSPENKQKGRTFYMTFEPDGGGWNNIRMAMETILGLAIATGRVLVLPPEQGMYLLRKDSTKQRTDFSFQDFFPMHEIAAEQDGLHIITMKEFLEREGLTGHLKSKETGRVEIPPYNRTDWNGQDVKPLKEWLRNVTLTPLWKPDRCMAGFPATADPQDAKELEQLVKTIHEKGDVEQRSYIDNPPPVDAPTYDRLRDNLNRRHSLCLYDHEMQQAPVLHFMCYHKMRVRFLTHFYSFLFLEDWREDLWMKRFIRDHVRYTDEIQCAAARIVQELRQLALNLTKTHEFDTFHVRRGDFQFKRTRIDAPEIYNNVKEILPGVDEPRKSRTKGTYQPGVIFIATDERDRKFFDPLRKHYPHIYFLSDFAHLLQGVNTNFYGMIDQLIASKGRLFFGCWHSTFSGYITRMRGYHSQNQRQAGYEKGLLLDTFYYVPHESLKAMHQYAPLQGAAFNRENPTSWRQLDYGIEAIEKYMQKHKEKKQIQ
ncbi:hypothetical protein ACA910_005747 [Epithemia clementina (nom. ined.)]